jgi:hypothetical protein
VDRVDEGSKISLGYDPTRRIVGVDPDVEAVVRNRRREIDGDAICPDITWTNPAAGTLLIEQLPVLVVAGPQDLMFLISLSTRKQELDARFVKFTPEEWRYDETLRVDLKFGSPFLRDLKQASIT